MCRVEAKQFRIVWLYCPVVWLPALMSTLDLKSVTLSQLPVQYCYCKTALRLLSPPTNLSDNHPRSLHPYATPTLKMEAAHFSTMLVSTNKTTPISIIYFNVTYSDFQSRNKLCSQCAFCLTSTTLPHIVWKSVHYQYLRFTFQACTWCSTLRSFTL